MEIHIYNTVHKPTGKEPGDIFLALVQLVDGGVKIECYDLKLKSKLEEIFSTPIIARTASDPKSGVITHKDSVVMPFTGEFFSEIVFRLYKYDLFGVLKTA